MKRQITGSLVQARKHTVGGKTAGCCFSSSGFTDCLDVDFFGNVIRSKAVMRKFAVVQWVSGEDAGMYSEVKTEAIHKYNDTKMDDDGYPKTDYSAAVEWQKGKKLKHGWPVYMASIKFVSMFPIDVLLVSNLRGTSRDSGPQHQALDKKKVDAIYRATLQKWPHVVPSSIGAAINAKLTEIRGKKKTEKHPETLMLFDD
ncbi:ATP-dependent RNA helicase DRS1 isoform X3 [Labeo rohita]|uniref:ATP-dependent RNA helicase DRS1 isoform X3 n=1 Tax=Labeo rohita TaxID=84645 RepID=A0A498LS45_LABRO|nr:ATP-dependent RNA helicase DRS1 isoform X3 [Labeo rohita]